MQPERDHAVEPGRSEVVTWNGRSGRHLRRGDRLRFRLTRRPGASTLRLVVWGDFIDQPIAVAVDGAAVRRGARKDRFAFIDHPLSQAGEAGRGVAVVDLTAVAGDAVIYEVRMLAAADAPVPVHET